MAGVKALRKIQLGKEVDKGTAVVATQVWRGEGVLKDNREIVFPAEDVGLLQGTTRFYVPKKEALMSFDETPATYQLLNYILQASVEKVASPTNDGVLGSGKIWQFDVATTVANDIQTFTIEMGDDQRVDEMEYSFVDKFTLSGAPGEAVMVQADWIGRQATDAEFTGSIALPTVEEILFGNGKLYIDATTIGTTQKTSTWLGFTLEVPSGWRAVYTGDGNLYFTAAMYKGNKENPITGTLILEHDGTAEAEITAARAGTLRFVRMRFLGTTLTTAGTSYTYRTLNIDMALKYTEIPELGDENEDDIVELPFRVVYDSTNTMAAQFILVNQDASLT